MCEYLQKKFIKDKNFLLNAYKLLHVENHMDDKSWTNRLREGNLSFSVDLVDDYYTNKCRYGRVKMDVYRSLDYFFNNRYSKTHTRILPKIDKVIDSLSGYKFSSIKIDLEFRDMGLRFEVECTENDDVIYYKNIYWALVDENLQTPILA